MSRVLILGGGFGGLTAATSLRSRLGPDHEIILIDHKDWFLMGLAKLWVLTGQRTLQESRRDRSLLTKKGIKFVKAEINKINPDAKSVTTTAGTITYDHLIIALGAELAPDQVPGFQEAALNLYDPDQVLRINLELAGFSNGKLIVLISSTPFKCPPAPYEATMLIDQMLRNRGVRDNIQLHIYTAEPMPIPIAGPTNSAKLQAWLTRKNVQLHVNHKPLRIDPDKKQVQFENGQHTNYDLLVAVPPHRSPKVARDAGLTDATGWIPVDPQTLKTKHDKIYAIGDVTSIKLPNGLNLPKAGIFAEGEANIVAEQIAAELEGGIALTSYDGRGLCFIETGNGQASVVQGEFYASPSPKVEVGQPSTEWLREKYSFEEVRLRKWFGE